MNRPVLNAFLTVVAIYAAIAGGLYLFQRGLIYHPGRTVMSPVDAGVGEMQAVRLETSDGLNAVSWYRAPQGNQPVVIYFQGNAGTIVDRVYKARPYLDRGLGVLLVGYRGYGENKGKPSEQGLYADGRAALGFLKTEGILPGRWVLYGESLGSGVAVELAHEQAVAHGRPVGAVVLEAPFASLVDMGKSLYPFVPVSLLLKDRFESASKVAAIQAPLLVIHGTKDGVVPIAQGRRLFEAARSPKEFLSVEGAGHNNLYDFGVGDRVSKDLPAFILTGRVGN